MTYLAFDLETVTDAPLARRVWGLVGSDTEVRKEVRARRLAETQGRTDFVKPLFHQVVAVGLASFNPATGALKVRSHAGWDEAALLTWFLGVFQDGKRPILVSWNGRQFDLPVVVHRGVIHQLNLRPLFGSPGDKGWEKYHYRYDGPHLDVADALTAYGGGAVAKLDEMALACGLAGKGGMRGDRVEALMEEGAIAEVEHYVARDAVDTLFLGLRLEAARGRLGDLPTYPEPAMAGLPDSPEEHLADDLADAAALCPW